MRVSACLHHVSVPVATSSLQFLWTLVGLFLNTFISPTASTLNLPHLNLNTKELLARGGGGGQSRPIMEFNEPQLLQLHPQPQLPAPALVPPDLEASGTHHYPMMRRRNGGGGGGSSHYESNSKPQAYQHSYNSGPRSYSYESPPQSYSYYHESPPVSYSSSYHNESPPQHSYYSSSSKSPEDGGGQGHHHDGGHGGHEYDDGAGGGGGGSDFGGGGGEYDHHFNEGPDF